MNTTTTTVKPQETTIQNVLRNSKSGNFGPLKAFLTSHKNDLHFSDLVYKTSGDSVLHVAAALGVAANVHLILRHFPDPSPVNWRNRDGKTPLHEACQFCRTQNVRVLLEKGAEVNAIKRADWTPLMLACAKTQEHESVDIVKMLLANGALLNLANKDGWNALHLVSRDGNVGVFRLLVEGGGDVCAVTKNGRTPLHIAALHGNVNVVGEILRLKPDGVNARDRCGNTPLHEAVLGNHPDVCRYLIGHGSEVAFRNLVCYDLLHFAASTGSLDMIRYLISEVRCDVNSIAQNGFTPLHCAARKGYKEACELLVLLGADEGAKDSFGRTAYDYLNA